MPLLFSYGTLQDESVQRSIFGRAVSGRRDDLPGFEKVEITIDGKSYANVQPKHDSHVNGTAFDITDRELSDVDVYEGKFLYTRIAAILASGMTAWLYLRAPRR